MYTLPIGTAADPDWIRMATEPRGGNHLPAMDPTGDDQSGTGWASLGSVTNANFKGKAPKASLYVLRSTCSGGAGLPGDFLQETAAQAPETVQFAGGGGFYLQQLLGAMSVWMSSSISPFRKL